MPIVNGAYVSPNWVNDTSPYINETEMNAISDTLQTVPVANGGTGATSAAAALESLGAEPKANVTSKGSVNTPVYFNENGIAVAISSPIPIALGGTGATTVAAARNALGLGSTTGALPVANGGTGATTASAALTNLGAEPKANVTSKGAVNTPVYFDANGVATPISDPLPVSLGGTGASSLAAFLTNARAVSYNDADVGDASSPVYIANGVATKLSSTVGSASKPVYLNAGTLTAMTGALAIENGGTGATNVIHTLLTGASGKIVVDYWQWGKMICVHVQGINLAGISTTTASNIIPVAGRPEAVGQVGCMTCGTDIGAYARCVVKNNGDVTITPNMYDAKNYNVTMAWIVE